MIALLVPGYFTLTYDGVSSGEILFDATLSDIKQALIGVTSAGSLSVTSTVDQVCISCVQGFSLHKSLYKLQACTDSGNTFEIEFLDYMGPRTLLFPDSTHLSFASNLNTVSFTAYEVTAASQYEVACVSGNFFNQDPHSFTYYGWDNMKLRHCVCDPGYADADCSKRTCPHGTDIMDHRENMYAPTLYQIQQIVMTPAGSATSLNGQTFALTFKSKQGETFTTIPIVYDTTVAGVKDFVEDVEQSLKALPNHVIGSGVTVGGTVDGLGGIALNFTFWGDNVQGQQELLVVKDIVCGDGCTPKLTGLEIDPTAQYIFERQPADFNSFECGRRGKCDYNSGVCVCFSGYSGESCNTITALV